MLHITRRRDATSNALQLRPGPQPVIQPTARSKNKHNKKQIHRNPHPEALAEQGTRVVWRRGTQGEYIALIRFDYALITWSRKALRKLRK